MNDIALLRLKEEVEFTNHTIRPFPLQNHDESIAAGADCFATGWGTTHSCKMRYHIYNCGKLWELLSNR